jgi:hypothetical protein
MLPEHEIIKGHCPSCGKSRKAFIRAKHVVEHPDDGDGTSASDTGMILECCGCERVYFRRDYWFSEWDEVVDHPVSGQPMMQHGIQTSYWPSEIARTRPKWLDALRARDKSLGLLLDEMYSALDADLRVLSAIGARTAFDRASELLGVDPAIRFQEKLDSLGVNGKISLDEEKTLEVLVNAGSAAAHRAWRPAPDELNTMVDVVESFLHRSFVVGDGIAKLKASVPAKPKRENA